VSHWEWVVASIVGILSVARTARLITYDDFPPMVWLRVRVLAWIKNEDSKWKGLLECPFCLAPYLAAGMLFWGWVSDTDTVWWVINGWWAASYVAAIVVAYDQPED